MTSIIHFIGLVAFTTQIIAPNSTRLTTQATPKSTSQLAAIMPRVNLSVPMNPPRKGGRQNITVVMAAIEPHTAIISFKGCDLLAANGWEIKALDQNHEYLYVELNGDQILFDVGGETRIADVKALGQVPRIPGNLKDEYKPPYSGAAAVFNISKGSLVSCISQPQNLQGQHVHKRRDTELILQNSGSVTIKTATKRLTLRGDAIVYAANIPTAALTGDPPPPQPNALPHYYIWCAMNGTVEQCMEPPSSSCPDEQPDPVNCPVCDDVSLVRTRTLLQSSAAPSNVFVPNFFTSFECSNTQWP